jgi:folate-binding protein YgfZ
MIVNGLVMQEKPTVLKRFPFSVLSMTGVDCIDFLQRISTNDFSRFLAGSIQKTLIVSDKGRIIDTVWVINRETELLVLTSKGSGGEVRAFLEKYIIMDDVSVADVSPRYSVNMIFESSISGYQTDYFGHNVTIELIEEVNSTAEPHSRIDQTFEQWRIENGIPVAHKEIVQDFNPLELNLWDWISFTKGCYIGQEVIARLDTYNKIQRTLCSVTSEYELEENSVIVDEKETDIGRITSAVKTKNGWIGLCVVRQQYAVENHRLTMKQRNSEIIIQKIFTKG